MKKTEKEKVKQAINHLLSDECNVNEALGLLAPLVGWNYPAAKALRTTTPVSIFKVGNTNPTSLSLNAFDYNKIPPEDFIKAIIGSK